MDPLFGARSSPEVLTRVLKQNHLLGTVGAQQDFSGSGGGSLRGVGAGSDVTEDGGRRHHVIPLEHGNAGEPLVQDVGRVLKDTEEELKANRPTAP